MTAESKSEGAEEPEINPSVSQQEEQPDATKGKVIADYDPDIDYERSKPKNKPDSQEKKEENTDIEYTNMEIPHNGTFHQRMMPCNNVQRIQHVHPEQGRDYGLGSRICTFGLDLVLKQPSCS